MVKRNHQAEAENAKRKCMALQNYLAEVEDQYEVVQKTFKDLPVTKETPIANKVEEKKVEEGKMKALFVETKANEYREILKTYERMNKEIEGFDFDIISQSVKSVDMTPEEEKRISYLEQKLADRTEFYKQEVIKSKKDAPVKSEKAQTFY